MISFPKVSPLTHGVYCCLRLSTVRGTESNAVVYDTNNAFGEIVIQNTTLMDSFEVGF